MIYRTNIVPRYRLIREIAAAMGGVVSALIAFFFVLFYPGVSTPAAMNTGFYRQLPIASPIYGPTNQTPSIVGVSGIYSGVLPAVLLVLPAVGAGIIASHIVSSRLKGDDVS